VWSFKDVIYTNEERFKVTVIYWLLLYLIWLLDLDLDLVRLYMTVGEKKQRWL